MPANLTPDYFAAEKRYREAATTAERIACLEEMLAVMPKHKGTDHLKADLRRKLSKLQGAAQTKKGATRHESVFQVEREGAGQVMVVGPPNSGKSSLVRALTNAAPEISNAPLSTWRPTPGMMPVLDIQIQMVDTPALTRDYVEPIMIESIRRCDLVLVVVDVSADAVGQLEQAAAFLSEHRIFPRHLGVTPEEPWRSAVLPFLVAANKCDDQSCDENLEILRGLLDTDWPLVGVSATTGRGLDDLKMAVFEQLEIVRIYSKAPNKAADLSEPFVVRKGTTLQEFASKVHKDFGDNLKSARVWGTGVYDGQMVQRSHVLHDGDIVELHA